MKSVTHQTTLHLSFGIKCCVDRLRPPPNNGHSSRRAARLLCARSSRRLGTPRGYGILRMVRQTRGEDEERGLWPRKIVTECWLCYNSLLGAGRYVRGADYDQEHSC